MRKNKAKIILDDVDSEINRAMLKFPTWPTDPIHSASVISEEYGELHQAVLQRLYEPEKSSLEDVRKEAIQLAAMAVRFLISLDSDMYIWEKSEQHNQANGGTDDSK